MPEVSLYRLTGDHQLDQYVDAIAVKTEPIYLADPERMLWRTKTRADGPPPWARLLAGGFPDEDFADRAPRDVAIVVLRLQVDRQMATWAAVFGPGGSHWLRHVDHEAHRIAAAQLLYDERSGTFKGLKRVVAGEVRHQAGTLTHQVGEGAPLSAFDFDEFAQALLAVSAESPRAQLGRTMSAANSIHLTAIKGWDQMLAAVDILERAVWRGRLDGTQLPGLRRNDAPPADVTDAFAAAVRGSGGSVALILEDAERARPLCLTCRTDAVAGIEDYGISDMRLDLTRAVRREALSWDDIVNLTLHDPAELAHAEVPVFPRLTGAVSVRDSVWALSQESWWCFPATWVARLGATIAKISVLDYPQLDAGTFRDAGGVQESLYNAHLATRLGTVLLDRQIMRLEAVASGIEVADLIEVRPEGTVTRPLIDVIAVKRGLGASSSLSHLFAQVRAAVGALEDPAARSVFVQRIVLQHVPAGTVRDAILQTLEARPFDPSTVRFVVAVAGKWGGRAPERAIPVLAQANLEPLLRRVRSAGFEIAIARIDEVGGRSRRIRTPRRR